MSVKNANAELIIISFKSAPTLNRPVFPAKYHVLKLSRQLTSSCKLIIVRVSDSSFTWLFGTRGALFRDLDFHTAVQNLNGAERFCFVACCTSVTITYCSHWPQDLRLQQYVALRTRLEPPRTASLRFCDNIHEFNQLFV